MTSQKLNEEHEILRRFMALVVSSAFKNSLTLFSFRKVLSVPLTSDPGTSAKAAWLEWEAYWDSTW